MALRIVIVIWLVLAVLAVALGQNKSRLRHQSNKSQREVAALDRKRGEALVRGDLAFLELTMADDYLYTNASGVVVTREEELTGFRSGETAFVSFAADEVQVHVYGKAAVVTARVKLKGRARGKDISGQYRYTRVWVLRRGRWQIVASHFSAIAQSN